VTDTPTTPMQQLWQQQPVEGTRMSIDEIRRRASRFEKKIMWRNVREYVAGGISVTLSVWFFIHGHKPLFRVACGLVIAGLIYMSYQLHRRASARSLPADMGAVNALQFHRAELERQRDFVAHVWRWYLGPLLPGMAAYSLIAVLAAHAHPWIAIFINLFFAGCLVLTWRLNVYAARCLQKKIDDLYAMETGE
jgi:hypothetical protein